MLKNNYIKYLQKLIGGSFSYFLIVYLTLYLLEVILPGFVSYSFNLNLLLVMILVSGLAFATYSEQAEVSEDRQINTFINALFVISLGLLTFFIFYFKSGLNGIFRLPISLSGSILISALSAISFWGNFGAFEDSYSGGVTENKTPLKFQLYLSILSRLFTKEVRIPIGYLWIFILFTILTLPSNIKSVFNSGVMFKEKEKVTEILPLPPQELNVDNEVVDMTILEKPSKDIKIQVLNGGAENGAARSLADVLESYGFANVEIGNAESYNYQNAILSFAPEDANQAELVYNLLDDFYETISETPSSSSSAEITVVLGDGEKERGIE